MSVRKGENSRLVSSYAKERVEEIRKKFGYAQADKQNHSKSKHQEPNSTKKYGVITQNSNKKQSKFEQASRNLSTQFQLAKEEPAYNNRIKHIDQINRRIMSVLGEVTSNGDKSKQNNKVKEPQIKPERRRNYSTVEGDLSALPNNEQIMPRSIILADKKKPEANTPKNKSYEQISMPMENQRQKQERYILNYPDNKQVQSIQLKSMELKKSTDEHKYQTRAEKESRNVSFKKNQRVFQSQPKQKPSQPKQARPKPDQQSDKKQTTKLAERLSSQILKDQKLRHAKWIFCQWQSPNKWQLLLQKHNKTHPRLQLLELQSMFTLLPEQHNPFFQKTQQINQTCLDTLLDTYTQASKYWQESVKQCVSIQNLEREDFNVRDLDLGKRGHITIEDIVCFVNLYAGNFFRNRDAITLMCRFANNGQAASKQGLQYETFLELVTR